MFKRKDKVGVPLIERWENDPNPVRIIKKASEEERERIRKENEKKNMTLREMDNDPKGGSC